MIRDQCSRLIESMAVPSHVNSVSASSWIDADQHSSSATGVALLNNADIIESSSGSISNRFVANPGVRLKRKDFLVRRTGASASALSFKRLEHELVLESLSV